MQKKMQNIIYYIFYCFIKIATKKKEKKTPENLNFICKGQVFN